MNSKENQLERFLRLEVLLREMVLDGRCDPEMTSDILQEVVNNVDMQITINHDMSFDDMIRAGKYDEVHEHVTKSRFSHNRSVGKVVLTPVLWHLDRPIHTTDLYNELEDRQSRFGSCLELLAFGAAYPEFQRRYPIATLGSSWQVFYPNSYPRVPFLGGDGSKRCVNLCPKIKVWKAHYRFLIFKL